MKGSMITPIRSLRIELARLDHRLRGPSWFPHVPLAVLLVLGGVLLLHWDLGAGWRSLLAGILAGSPQLAPLRLPQLLIGVGMLIIGLGLLFRSRVAWVMALLLSVTAIASLTFGHRPHGPVLPAYFIVILGLLIAAGRKFDRSSVTAGTLFALTSVVMLLLYATFGAYYLGGDFKPPITDLLTALYYAIVTTSTVGYGDIIPQTPEARIFSVSLIVFGVAVFATSLTAVIAPMVSRSVQSIVNRKYRHMKRENHFVVIGNTSLAVNTWRELVHRGQAVTRVIRQSADADAALSDVVIGDPGNVDVLREAGADKAHAVLAMLGDDSDNAFVALAVRELGGGAKTVVAVNDAAHLARVRLVQPDVVIAPQILGGELAAMIMCGEEVTSEFVMKSVFLQDAPAAKTATS